MVEESGEQYGKLANVLNEEYHLLRLDHMHYLQLLQQLSRPLFFPSHRRGAGLGMVRGTAFGHAALESGIQAQHLCPLSLWPGQPCSQQG